MLNLFDNFDQASFDLLRSQRSAQIKIPTVVINDDGFLPAEVESPIKFFGQYNENKLPLYFDQLPVPKYWRILSTSSQGEVYDLDQKRADIIYRSNDNSRQVKEVRWLDRQGKINWADHYNNNGYHFATTFYEQGQPIWRKYYNKYQECFLAWNLRAGSLFLTDNGQKRYFASWIEFVKYYLTVRHFKLDHIFYNTLNQGLSVTLALPDNGTDTLFWHEPLLDNKLPGNMQFLMEHSTRTKHIIFQRYSDWQQMKPTLTGNKYVDFSYLGMIYPHPRGNKLRPEALILTNSDEIVAATTLVKQLPQVKFHIAAVTEMSEKLLAYQQYSNVELYPNVSRQRVKQLIADCDIYLDINRQNEILDAVRGAFEQNMLIVGFDETLHEPQFVAPQNVFKVTEASQMGERILNALLKPALMKELIDTQRKLASEVSVQDYRNQIGALEHE
ncbi:accessory Sec system glycosylation chaperone GtfB [Limosilactobacillus albertensis]|uniref:UDP-N-acetylglucosamine--peptide N-acetylglucosaminyltransferase stabilizing protein GtfB n=1 Tax=Limosilactobacillus albertensis TaxID=2759752 RepID=A0A839HB41_9LACO|nr:accessory Sec system glycosylation chaperone GtfB [Limosilactobacillus albertensis]MBB1124528.1 accessory Sec system glycosylation chaperone GtfB [Limosilactobacillus albertensis]MCD7123061.1 accessory Sec system glycosylation chaperone GtfB [Limosilactobacillus albertensis]